MVNSRLTPPNAEIVFASNAGGFQYNPETGNDEPVAATETTLVASLISDRGRSRDPERLEPGSNRHITYFLGRCVEPRSLPTEIDEQTVAECTITEPVSGRQQVGRFHFVEVFSSRHERVQKRLGAKFRGYFIEGEV